MTGTLFYDMDADRLDISFEDASTYGGLHCGEPLEVLMDGEWKRTRVEKADDWFLVGLYRSGRIPIGLTVRRVSA